MAEETKEVQTEQESPTVEEEQPVEATEEAQPSKAETDQEKNWRALREENERLKQQLAGREEIPVDNEVQPLSEAKNSPAVSYYLTSEVQNRMQFEEFKAEQSFPELETDPLFADVVAGKYRRALDEYVNKLTRGEQAVEPSAFKIAKQTKSAWEGRLGTVKKTGEQEGAQKAKQFREEREATVEAEGRSDRGVKAENAAELSTLRKQTREGNLDAVVKRLSNIG